MYCFVRPSNLYFLLSLHFSPIIFYAAVISFLAEEPIYLACRPSITHSILLFFLVDKGTVFLVEFPPPVFDCGRKSGDVLLLFIQLIGSCPITTCQHIIGLTIVSCKRNFHSIVVMQTQISRHCPITTWQHIIG